ncbi:putative RNaseH [Vibrio phage Va1]|nr:putative RNaseH [Vibrio phage Va1]
MIAASIANTKPRKVDGKYVTSEFINFTKYLILQELFTVQQQYKNKYGDLVICLDNSRDGYWRNDFYVGYKESRKKAREESEVNFREVFAELNVFMDQIRNNLPWKVIDVPKAEADDIMLVLAREFNPFEPILIHSPDKDMIQAQRNTDNVQQYSSLTKKWIVPETKGETMDEWIREHVCLGDECDGVPKVVDHTEFSDNFLAYLKENGVTLETPYEFKTSNLTLQQKRDLLDNYQVYRVNRKGEELDEKDVYKKIRFGPSTLKKQIEKYGSIDEWLDSHPLYRGHYNRNFTLVMEEGIPSDIWNEIIIAFKEAKTDYNDQEFERYLKENNLDSILMELPNIFKVTRELTADDFGW